MRRAHLLVHPRRKLTKAPPVLAASSDLLYRSLSFTQGFLLGQLSIAILIGAFIKFFVFGEIPSPETSASSQTLARRLRSQKHHHHHLRSSSSLLSPAPSPQKGSLGSGTHSSAIQPRRSSSSVLDAATILSKTYYNVQSHQPESLDWFNVLIAQTIAQFRQDALEDEAILTSLTDLLNGAQKPDFLAEIKVTEIDLGDEYPILSNCRVHPVSGASGANGEDTGTRLQAHMDVDLTDAITLGIDTKLILNYPRPNTAVLPVALAVSILRFSGTLSISFLPSSSNITTSTATTTTPSPPQQSGAAPASDNQQPQPPDPSTARTSLAFSFLPDYRLDLSVRSLVGSRSRLQDIPKIAQLVESRLHQWIEERCVEPRVQHVPLPSFWPRRRNTREAGAGTGSTVGESDGREGSREGERRSGSFGRNAGAAAAAATVARGTEGLGTGWAARNEQDRDSFEEGLRKRRREYDMPGAMPGMTVVT